MKQRIISTVSLWLTIIIGILLFGAHAGVWLITACSILAQFELYKLLEKSGYKPLKELGLALGFLLIPGIYYFPGNEHVSTGLIITLLAFIILVSTLLFQPHKDYVIRRFFPTIFGFLLIPFTLQSFALLLQYYGNQELEAQGIMLCVWIIAVTKFTDVGALLVGKQIGKNKLAPTISPNKTWEGVVGGVILSVLVGMLLFIALNPYFPENFRIWHVGLIAVPVAGCGIVADLIESIIKRQAESKDSGNIIPGIGGMFDLIDSLVLSAPVGYILIMLFVG